MLRYAEAYCVFDTLQVLHTLYQTMFPDPEASASPEDSPELTPRLTQAAKKNVAQAAEREALLQRPRTATMGAAAASGAGGRSRPTSAAWKPQGTEKAMADFLRPQSANFRKS